MEPTTAETPYLRESGYAERYRDQRFQSGTGAKTHRREVRALQLLLRQVPPATTKARLWLDLPAGAGRMSSLLPGPALQVDRNPKMLLACPQTLPQVCATAQSLPFGDQTFAGVLCLRLLHHIGDPQERLRILRELGRVSGGPVLFSFFHAICWQHARRQVARYLGKKPSGRHAMTWRRCQQEMHAAGLIPLAWQPLGRFFSEQWLVLAMPNRLVGG